MTLKLLGKTSTALLASTTVGLVASVPAMAADFTIDTVGGNWTGTTGGTNINFQTVGNENQVRWGNNIGNGQSGLGFEGATPPPIAQNFDDVFELGILRHFNNGIASGTAASEAFLTISLAFSDPAGLNETFDFTFGIDETPNVTPCTYPSTTPCADRISFSNAFQNKFININGTDVTLELLGFRQSPTDPIINEFISQEGGTSSATLYGRITANPVPEPLTILGAGTAISFGTAFKRKLGQVKKNHKKA